MSTINIHQIQQRILWKVNKLIHSNKIILTSNKLHNIFSKQEITMMKDNLLIKEVMKWFFVITNLQSYNKINIKFLQFDILSLSLQERNGLWYAIVWNHALYMYNNTMPFEKQKYEVIVLSQTNSNNYKLWKAINVISKETRKNIPTKTIKNSLWSYSAQYAIPEYLLFDMFYKQTKTPYDKDEAQLFIKNQQFNLDVMLQIFTRKAEQQRLFDYTVKNKIENHSLIVFYMKLGFIDASKQSTFSNAIKEIKYSRQYESNWQMNDEKDIKNMKRFYWSMFEFVHKFENHKLWTDIEKPQIESFDIIKRNIVKNEISDTFHNISIEWYKTTEDQVEFILTGNYPDFVKTEEQKKLFSESIRNITVIKAYNKTQHYIVQECMDNWWKITEQLLKTINYKLFENTEDWLQTTKLENHTYRNHPVIMNGSDWYYPPKEWYIEDLIQELLLYTNQIKNPLLKAFYLHWCLVPTQPFSDGNGRTSRLLMNMILLQNWYRWITIDNHKYRLEYLSWWAKITKEKLWDLKKEFTSFITFLMWELHKSYIEREDKEMLYDDELFQD